MLHWLCNGTYNRRIRKHSHTMQTIKWNKLTVIFSVHIHEQISLHLLPLFITVGSTLARAEHCTWHVGSLTAVSLCVAWHVGSHTAVSLCFAWHATLTAVSLCFAWHVTLTWTSDQFQQIHRGQQGVSREVVGLSTLAPSSLDHTKSVGFRNGGFGSKACYQTATWRWTLATFSLNASLVGGSEQSFGALALLLPTGHLWTIHLHRCCPRRWGFQIST